MTSFWVSLVFLFLIFLPTIDHYARHYGVIKTLPSIQTPTNTPVPDLQAVQPYDVVVHHHHVDDPAVEEVHVLARLLGKLHDFMYRQWIRSDAMRCDTVDCAVL